MYKFKTHRKKIIADLTIGKGPFKDTYKSDVAFNKKTDSIYVKNIEGPLNHLTNNWTFTDKNNGITEITFDIDFEIKNKFLNSLMVVSFQFGLEKIADAFQKRAEELSEWRKGFQCHWGLRWGHTYPRARTRRLAQL